MKHQLGRIVFASIAAAFLPFASPGAAQTIAVPAAALVVVDGDTVRLDGQRLRLLDIDAPETHQAHCSAERRAGKRARAALTAALTEHDVTIVYSGRIDPFRRPLVHLFVDGADIGQGLLAAGLALPYVGGRAAHASRIAHWCGR
ncbi:MAG TPA: thermonuclease family protein [Kaistia sp.]|nr:thermonuclease family protein [Kaistia sp.]